MSRDSLPESTRRAVLRSLGAAVGVGAAGTAAGHPGGEKSRDGSIDGPGGEAFELDDGEPFRNAEAVGYHSIYETGRAGVAGRRAQRRGGDRHGELRVHGDIGVVCFRASDDSDAGRRMAVLDISEFNDAATREELREAEPTVLGILRNINAETNGATDVELSGDGNYAFLATQALYPVLRGSNGQVNETDPRATPQATGGVVAVDITDPGRPRTVDSVTELFSTGVHNLDHHRIDGTDYVFACKDAGFISPDSGLVVLRFDRDRGKLVFVNRWTADGNTVRGGVGPEQGLSYMHDVEVHDDPRTGRPTAYLADWDRGMRVLDVSDPTNIQRVGQFDMYQSHWATPFPELVEMPNGETKRVAVTSHEEPDERFDQREDILDSNIYNTPHPDKTNPNSTGTVFLVDCDGIYPDDPGYDGDGPTQLGELDNWTWKNVDTDEDVTRETILQERFGLTLSPHNSEAAVHEIDGEETFVVHQGHYHGGVRHIAVRPGTEDGLTEIDGGTPGEKGRRRYRPTGFDPGAVDGYEDIDEPGSYPYAGEPFGWINNSTDWEMEEVGHARPVNEETGNLTPDFWCSVEHNGVVYSSDRSAGAFATAFDLVDLRRPLPPLEVERADDGSAFLAGQTNRIDVTVETFERGNGDAAEVRVRDRIPDGYEVVAGDDAETYPQGNRTAVEFTATVEPGETVTFSYFVEVPDDPDSGTFGPVEVSSDGREWDTVGGTTDSNLEAGVNV